MCILCEILWQMFVHSSTVCRKAEEHLWAGVVVAFLQTVLGWTNFFLNVKIVSYINIDFLYIYFAHFIGYSSGLK